MKFLVTYSDSEGYGSTIVSSTKGEISPDEAAEAILEQLHFLDIPVKHVQIHEFEEIKNPIDWAKAELLRVRLID
jgi:hypothetical protein